MFPDVPGMMGVMGNDRARVARLVINRRGELGLTQQELADRAQVDIKTIYNLESGERWPQARNRFKIERALGWVAGSLDALAEGKDAGFQFPTRAELIDDALRRRGLTSGQAARLARVNDDEWEDLTAGSVSIADARAEDPATAPAVARIALVLGIVPEQLANAGQERAAEALRDLLERAVSSPADQIDSEDEHLRRLLELWPRTQEWQRRMVVGVLEQALNESPTMPTGTRKPEQEDERRAM